GAGGCRPGGAVDAGDGPGEAEASAEEAGVARHGRMAASPEAPQERALGQGLRSRSGVIHGPQRFQRMGVGRSRLHAQDPLPHRREKFVHAKRVSVLVLDAQALEPRARHNETVAEAFVELAEPCVDGAPYGLDVEVGTSRQKEHAPSEARGGDTRAPRQLIEAAARSRQKDVARVFARRKGRERKAVGKLRGHVLEAVDARVHPAVEQRLLDLPDEERLASEVREGDVGETVAGGADDDDLDVDSARGASVGDLPRLHEGKSAAARAEAELHDPGALGPSPKSSEITSIQRRPWPARDESRSLTVGA